TCGSTLNSNHLCSSVIHITQPGANPTGIWRGIETRLSIPLSLPNLREGLVPVIDRGLAGVAGTPRFVAAGVISKDAAMNQQHSYDESSGGWTTAARLGSIGPSSPSPIQPSVMPWP